MWTNLGGAGQTKLPHADIYAFIAELIKGDPNDKVYQKQLIDNIIAIVYVYDNCVIPYLTVGNDKSVQRARLAECGRVQSQLPIPDHFVPNWTPVFVLRIKESVWCRLFGIVIRVGGMLSWLRSKI